MDEPWVFHSRWIAVTVRGHLLVQHFPSDFPCTKQTNGWTRLALNIHRKPLVHPFLWDLNWMHGTCPNQAHEPFFAYVCFCVNIVVPIRRLSCMFLVPRPLATETMTPWPVCIHFQEYLLNTWFAGPRTDSFRLFKLWSGWDLFKLAC